MKLWRGHAGDPCHKFMINQLGAGARELGWVGDGVVCGVA